MEFFCLPKTFQEKSGASAIVSAGSTGFRLLGAVGLAVMLTACASNSNTVAQAPEPAPQMVSLEEWLTRARLAAAEGNADKTRAAYRAAAQIYPAEKMPWLKLAEDYFNAQDYGNAVIAAQEALQRDTQDHLAHSILAVSGLRLTAGSLVALRQEGHLPVGSRDEAISVARALRDTLGAASLLPPAAPANAPRPRKPAPATATAAAGPAAVRTAAPAAPGAPALPGVIPTAATPAAAQTSARTPAAAASPFDKLK